MDIREEILRWFSEGETGISSETMAFAAVRLGHQYSTHPHDPADFNRCLLLLEAVPEVREAFDRIAGLSEEWERVIANWGRIERTFLDEVGRNWCKAKSAPETYRLMRSIIEDRETERGANE